MSFMLTNKVSITVGGVTYDSLDDFGLAIHNTDYIGTPVCEELNTVYVPGKSGILDFVDTVFGEQYYNYRPIKIEFGGIDASEDWDAKISDLRNIFHGRTVKLTFATIPEWYFTGRATIEEFNRKRGLGTFSFCINYADPWMYKTEETTYTAETGNVTVECENSRKSVVPSFTTTGSCVITFGDITKEIGNAGTYKFNDIIFKEGTNTINISSNSATTVIKYREGAL